MDSGDIPFHRLLERVAGIKGILRVNFLTSHPMDFHDDIVRVVADHGNITRSMHLPLQSGSDRILALMNRKYTMARYHAIIEHLQKFLPDHAVSTDLIVGFPRRTRGGLPAYARRGGRVRFDEAFMYVTPARGDTVVRHEGGSDPRAEDRAPAGAHRNPARDITRKTARPDRPLGRAHRRGQGRKSPGEYRGRTYLNHPAVLPAVPATWATKYASS